jgi:hypothetical protein
MPQPGSKGKKAPANFEQEASSLILQTKATIESSSCWKTRLLHSRQIFQLANIMRDWSPFRSVAVAPPIQRCNHSLIDVAWFQVVGLREGKRNIWAIFSQIFVTTFFVIVLKLNYAYFFPHQYALKFHVSYCVDHTSWTHHSRYLNVHT